MVKIATHSKRDVYIHLGIILCLLTILFLGFFLVYLPASTNHGETITVPNLKGMTTEEIEDFLDDRNLRFEVSDCTFVPGAQALEVLTQYPTAGAKVKEGRKIYVTITALNAPQIKMPALTGLSQRNAESFLKSYGLLMGQITYRDDLAENIVLEQLYQGKKIEANALIPKGSKIDLVIGNGLGNTELDVPDVLGKTLEEAKALIVGSDLQVGLIQYDPESTEAPGTIIRQNPSAGEGNKIRVGDIVDLWIAGPEPPKDGTATL